MFRRAYDYDLDSARVKNLAETVLDSFDSVEKDKNNFLKFLKDNLT
jgi:hypothetical protein